MRTETLSAVGTAQVVSGMDAPEPSASPYEFRAVPHPARELRRATDHESFQSGAAQQEALEQARRESLEQGRREGERSARAQMESGLALEWARQRERTAAVLQEFLDTRNRYFADAEQQVVRLALAIAAHVLHREVQLDPLLLTGVVRVALSQLADRSGVVLRVPEVDVAAWQEVFVEMDSADRPAIAAAPSLARGECVLETSVGSVELGIAAQLEEIERGFFDLLSHRPSS